MLGAFLGKWQAEEQLGQSRELVLGTNMGRGGACSSLRAEAQGLEGTTGAAPADLMPYWWGLGRAQQPLLRELLAPNCFFSGRESELA